MKTFFKKFNVLDCVKNFKLQAVTNDDFKLDDYYYEETDKRYLRKNGEVRAFCIDITELVQAQIAEAGIQNGFVVCSSMHTTSSVILNHFEEGLLSDIFDLLGKQYPLKNYKHNIWDSVYKNADAHLMSMHIGKSSVVNIVDSSLVLGEYDNVIYVEFDMRPNKCFSIAIYGE